MADANSRTCIVYGLFAKSDGRIRYVGQTTVGLGQRLRGHLKRARTAKRPVYRDRWISAVSARGDEVGIILLQADAAWNRSEREWIARLKADGCNLVNLTAGGDGMLDASPELRKRISDSVKELWKCGEYRQKAAGSRKGVPWSAAQMDARMSVAPEVRSERARRGRSMLTDERRSAISSEAAKAGWEKRRASGKDRGEFTNQAKLTDEKVMEIRRLRAGGKSCAAIARELGMAARSIGSALSGKTWSHLPILAMPEISVCGESIHNATLTEAQVMDIRRRAASGEPMPSIGASYGKSRSAIRIIVTGLTWKHLPVLGYPSKRGARETA